MLQQIISRRGAELKVKPTNRHQETARLLVENWGNLNWSVKIGDVLREVGYSEAVAKNPYKVTRRKGFRQALLALISYDDMLNMLKSLSTASILRIVEFPSHDDDITIKDKFYNSGIVVMSITKIDKVKYVFLLVPDYKIRNSAMNMMLRVQGELDR